MAGPAGMMQAQMAAQQVQARIAQENARRAMEQARQAQLHSQKPKEAPVTGDPQKADQATASALSKSDK